jgi:hypothetical protein
VLGEIREQRLDRRHRDVDVSVDDGLAKLHRGLL